MPGLPQVLLAWLLLLLMLHEGVLRALHPGGSFPGCQDREAAWVPQECFFPLCTASCQGFSRPLQLPGILVFVLHKGGLQAAHPIQEGEAFWPPRMAKLSWPLQELTFCSLASSRVFWQGFSRPLWLGSGCCSGTSKSSALACLGTVSVSVPLALGQL